MSKSGLFAHFGSKEELQLATIDAAQTVFTQEVITPASGPETAIDRLRESAERSSATCRETSSPAGASSPRSRQRWTRARARSATARRGCRRMDRAARRSRSGRTGRGRHRPCRGRRAARLRDRGVSPARERPVRGEPLRRGPRPRASRDRHTSRLRRASLRLTASTGRRPPSRSVPTSAVRPGR